MREVYTMPSKTTLDSILEMAGKFVVAQKGQWGHEEWEGFVSKVAALGVSLSDETKRNLGNILETCKYFYAIGAAQASGAAAPKKKAAAKPKAKAK